MGDKWRKDENRFSPKGKSSAHALVTNHKKDTTRKSTCAFCQNDHSLPQCPDFQALDEKDRLYNFHLKMGHICSKCLMPKDQNGHPKSSYKCERKCSIASCQGFHHELLHLNQNKAEARPKENARTLLTKIQTNSSETSYERGVGSVDTILPTARVRIFNGDKSKEVRIGFDSLSHMTFFTSSLVKEMGFETSNADSFVVQGFGGHEYKETKAKSIKAVLGPLDPTSTERIMIEGHVKDGDICSPLGALDIDFDQCAHLANLSFADQFPQSEAPIDILIGGRYYYQLMDSEIILPDENERDIKPIAVKSLFGYIIAGPCHKELLQQNCGPKSAFLLQKNANYNCAFDFDKLDKKIERFWEHDAIGLLDKQFVRTQKEREAEEIFKNTTVFDGERYVVELPFSKEKPAFQSNYPEAVRRLKCTEKQLERSIDRKEKYENAIMEYVKLGFSRELNNTEAEEILKQEHFIIPHHAVFKENRVSTKVRIVFDASAKNRDGISLNETLLPGPNLLPDIASVLLRFRMHPVAITADIQKMFPQTKVHPKHHPFQIYLWRHCDKEIEPKLFVMERVLFGITSSPFLCISSIHKHADDNLSKFGETFCDTMKQNIYMDDVLIGGENEDEVMEKYKILIDFFSTGGWNLTKFASNSQAVMDEIPIEKRLPSLIVELDESDYGLAGPLGLKWHTIKDTLFCNVKPQLLQQDPTVTKRSILSKLSSIYDVFGFFAAFVIRAKILIQELWKKKLDWDVPITGEIEQKYRQWTDEIAILDTIELPRSPFRNIRKQQIKSIQLHGFADASLVAYGAVFYLRVESIDGEVEVAYLMAKTRVASLKKPPIARLELLAAHSLAKLKDYIIRSIGEEIYIDEIHYWLDSEISLAWIAKPSTKWKGFVRNRVQDIHDLTSVSDWKHCPGKDNPADFHSRGMKLQDLKTRDSYWKGPSWLIQDKSKWPQRSQEAKVADTTIQEIEKELCPQTVLITTGQEEKYPEVISRFNDYNKILRVTARILQWKRFASGTKQDIHRFIRVEDLSEAENCLFRRIQQIRFPDEFSTLENGRCLSKHSLILSHDPRWDPERRLIIGGDRLSLSSIPLETKSPIILPHKDELVQKLILYVHIKNCHCTQDTTLTLLRQRYQIVHFRNEVRKALKKCLICRHASTKPLEQKMGILPEERVNVSPAFSEIGLDFTGVVFLKSYNKRTTRKAYICIFTCAHSRMVHFELTNDLSTEEFLSALRRMINRRGWCHTIFSDNQSTFKKANRMIQYSVAKTVENHLNEEFVNKFLVDNGICWKFIAERSPHRGAFYERMNRSLKEPLRKILGHACLNYSEMYSLLTDIEASLNQRPLTYIGSDPMNLNPITPAHLAFGRPLQPFPVIEENRSKGLSVGRRYKHLQMVLSHFWQRWSTEYLPLLSERKCWVTEKTVPKVGDVCLVSEKNTSRPTWPLGRIIEAIKGRDGLVRTFRLRTQDGEITRPIQKLHLIEEDESNNFT